MAIDWDNIDVDGIIDDAATQTDNELASKISSLTRMTDAEIKELFPAPADAKKLIDLMTIVKSSEDQNVKVNKIVNNAEQFGSAVFTLLNRFV
ncbi:MAG: hypothetical protein ACI9LM_001367 [Alteromonadaceae bacterium]|jgi:hypothetical protein